MAASVLVEDTDQRIVYSGNDWTAWNTPAAATVASNATAVQTDKSGSTIRFSFPGDSLTLRFLAHPNSPTASVSIDSGTPSSYDLSGTDTGLSNSDKRIIPKLVAFSSFSCTSHDVVITNTGSSPGKLLFDAFSYNDPTKGGACFGNKTTILAATTTAAAAHPEEKHRSVGRIAGFAMGGIVFGTALLIIVYCIISRCRRAKAQAQARQDSFTDNLAKGRRRLSQIVATYQTPTTEVLSHKQKKSWNNSTRSSLTSGPTTPKMFHDMPIPRHRQNVKVDFCPTTTKASIKSHASSRPWTAPSEVPPSPALSTSRPKTSSAVEHFGRTISLDRPLSSILISRPARSPLRTLNPDVGVVKAGPSWDGYIYNVAEEKAMWTNRRRASMADVATPQMKREERRLKTANDAVVIVDQDLRFHRLEMEDDSEEEVEGGTLYSQQGNWAGGSTVQQGTAL